MKSHHAFFSVHSDVHHCLDDIVQLFVLTLCSLDHVDSFSSLWVIITAIFIIVIMMIVINVIRITISHYTFLLVHVQRFFTAATTSYSLDNTEYHAEDDNVELSGSYGQQQLTSYPEDDTPGDALRD